LSNIKENQFSSLLTLFTVQKLTPNSLFPIPRNSKSNYGAVVFARNRSKRGRVS